MSAAVEQALTRAAVQAMVGGAPTMSRQEPQQLPCCTTVCKCGCVQCLCGPRDVLGSVATVPSAVFTCVNLSNPVTATISAIGATAACILWSWSKRDENLRTWNDLTKRWEAASSTVSTAATRGQQAAVSLENTAVHVHATSQLTNNVSSHLAQTAQSLADTTNQVQAKIQAEQETALKLAASANSLKSANRVVKQETHQIVSASSQLSATATAVQQAAQTVVSSNTTSMNTAAQLTVSTETTQKRAAEILIPGINAVKATQASATQIAQSLHQDVQALNGENVRIATLTTEITRLQSQLAALAEQLKVTGEHKVIAAAQAIEAQTALKKQKELYDRLEAQLKALSTADSILARSNETLSSTTNDLTFSLSSLAAAAAQFNQQQGPETPN